MAARSALVPLLFLLALLIAGATAASMAVRVEPEPDAEATPDKCSVDVDGLVSKCGKFIVTGGPKKPPSGDCCRVIRATDISCACSMIKGQLPVQIDMGKVCFVLSKCEKSVPPGFRCGRYVIPATC